MTEYQELLDEYCGMNLLDTRALDERRRLIREALELKDRNPAWFTLQPRHEDGRCWRAYLIQNFGIEDYALETLGQIAGVEGLGQFELNRILGHLMKDSSSGRLTERNDPSKWLQKTCLESLRAMSEYALWDEQEQRRKGLEYVHHGGQWDFNWSWEQPVRTSYPRGGSSSNWQGRW